MNALGLTHTVTAWRRRWYRAPHRPRRLARPVISVGNLAFGGRGKTPAVAYLSRVLIDAGERPAILTRGYARAQPQDGVVVVSDGVHCRADLARSGDEPLMLARATPGAAVLVSDDRALAGALAERAFDVTVHILDDGFQHVQLHRDVDIVLVVEQDLTSGATRLRESPDALRFADAVVVEGSAVGSDVAAAARDSRDHRQFRMTRALGAPHMLDAGEPLANLSAPVVAVAGIAEPERFKRALTSAGYTVARALTFRDHHRYTPADLSAIADAVRDTRAAAVVTTEKDAMRLLPLRPLPFVTAIVPLQVAIAPADQFRDWLLGRLREARA